MAQQKQTSSIQARLTNVANKVLKRWEQEQQTWDNARQVFQQQGLMQPDFTPPPTNLSIPQALNTSAGRAALLQSAGTPTLGGIDPVNVGISNLGNVLAAGQGEREKVVQGLNEQAIVNANVANTERTTNLEAAKPYTNPAGAMQTLSGFTGSGFKLNDMLGYAKFVKGLVPKEPVDMEELKPTIHQVGDVNSDSSIELTDAGMTVRPLPPGAQQHNAQARQFAQSAEVAQMASLYAGAPQLRQLISIPQTDIVVWKDGVESQYFGRDNVTRRAVPVKVPADIAPLVFNALDSSNNLWNSALEKLIVTAEQIPENHPLAYPLQQFVQQQLDQIDPRMAQIIISDVSQGG